MSKLQATMADGRAHTMWDGILEDARARYDAAIAVKQSAESEYLSARRDVSAAVLAHKTAKAHGEGTVELEIAIHEARKKESDTSDALKLARINEDVCRCGIENTLRIIASRFASQ